MIHIPVEEYSTPCPFITTPKARIAEVLAAMRKLGIRHAPVEDETKVVGIVSERNINTILSLNHNNDFLIEEIMVKDPYTVNMNDPLEKVALGMSERKIGSAIVVNKEQKCVGIFTSTDALNALIEVLRGEAETD